MIEANILKKISDPHLKGLEIDVKISKGSFIGIYGKSGAGKTTFLKLLSGLVTPDEGVIKFDDTIWFDKNNKIHLKPQDRNIGYVFQDYALFPNMNVRENLEFVIGKEKDKSWVNHLLEITELKDLSSKKPLTLSGGQQQRLALARALVRKPNLLLLDEPFSALDSETRLSLHEELQRLYKELHLTIIMVSHNVEELYHLTSDVYQMKSGKLAKEVKEEVAIGRGKLLEIIKRGEASFARVLCDGKVFEVEWSE